MGSIAAKYVIVNCQDRAKWRRKDKNKKILQFALSETEEIPEADAETLKQEILIPSISREGKERIKEVYSSDESVHVNFDYIKREDAENKYLKKGEAFAVPEGKKLARITLTKLPVSPEPLPNLANIDRVLGFPDYQAEKPFYATKD